MTDWNGLATGDEISVLLRYKKKDYTEKTIFRSALEDEESEGWRLYKELKNPKKVKVRKNLSAQVVFENRLWVLMASMGFSTMNRNKNFTINYSKKDPSLTKQIDVFAVDAETALVIECKCADSPKGKAWKVDLEAIKGYKGAVQSEIQKQFPNVKVKFIFATKDYIVGDADKKRLDDFGIAHFDEKTIKYYEDLVNCLGTASRYQLLAQLFAKQEIRNLDTQIPAIQGKMGKYTYYSFSIKPETLLKIGYVLHRHKVNSSEDMMPAYQRIIKKSRLNSVRKFVDEGHFFPNSIIVSVESKGKLRFDLADKQGNDCIAKMGILHLPNKYCSAFIIDGQHRLYGYSGSKYAETNTIPVVAFENLPKQKQVELFMEINENQKAVPKNLRNTLNADLLWYSDKPSELRTAIRSRIAQDLGEKYNSPLKNRVIIGENQSDDYCCITLEVICAAIEDTRMLSKYSKDEKPIERGIFDYDDNEKTCPLLTKYIFGCFSYLREQLPEEWTKKPIKEGGVLYNNGVGGLIRLFGDIAVELKNAGHDPWNIDDFLYETHYYLDPVANYLKTMSVDEKEELRSNYGSGGRRDYWRHLERAVHNARPNFIPDGYVKYWEDHSKEHNDESITIMTNIEKAVRAFIHKTLLDKYPGETWIQEIPAKIYLNATSSVSKQLHEKGEHVDVWDCFTLSDLREIVLYGNHWSGLYESYLTIPSESKMKGGKKSKTDWMDLVDKLQKNVGRSTFSVSKDDFTKLQEIEGILPNLQNQSN